MSNDQVLNRTNHPNHIYTYIYIYVPCACRIGSGKIDIDVCEKDEACQ